jgi:hypothetical protein
VYVVVDLGADPAAVSLVEPSDCTRFHLAVRGPSDPVALGRVLAATESGWLNEQGAAFVSIGALRRLSVGRVQPGWDTAFQTMIDWAASKGWTNPEGTAIQAHVAWESEAQGAGVDF